MKKVFILTLLLSAYSALAQEEKETKTYRMPLKTKKVSFLISNAEVAIQGYDGTDIVIEAKGVTPPPKEAEGLKAVGAGGTDNTGINLSSQTENGVTIFKTALRQDEISYVIRLPKNTDLLWKSGNNFFANDDELTITGIEGEIEVRTASTNINLKDITGPVIAYSTMGKISAQFSKVNQNKPISLSTSHEAIDVSLPSDTKASVILDASQGNAFTDFDLLPLPEKEAKQSESQSVDGLVVVGSGSRRKDSENIAKGATSSKNNSASNSSASSISISTKDVNIQTDNNQILSFASAKPFTINNIYINGNATKGIINAPGVSITLKSSMGNIYLRKRK
ncbi:hypothetical protein [Siphonobacter sp. SORGH_AS_1065]|uniref:hypothetical protein n=1 Tax=Siphonobacter sp. SORGH_AS_1065 TaxID=3041795 RepID=UPI0027890090|nr:hypothetical protein [Siphonobacter sp. SORGH_AS_1065]MDQ1086889.1 hypothetical protein [Siphonobacter sp. SORGH_AS_1065]